jgi:hypothetical protein
MPLQATSGAASYDAFGGGVPVVPNYIEECFSCFLYTGNSSSQTITNGIDLSTKGGLVWIKDRTTAQSHNLFDTARGPYRHLESNGTNGSLFDGQRLSSFTTSGFSVESRGVVNLSGSNFASWTFRKQPKFFDVVTYTGDGTGGSRQVAHNLGSTPGCVFIKRTDASGDWMGFHRGTGATNSAIAELSLNLTTAPVSGAAFSQSLVTSTYFVAGDIQSADGGVSANASGATYVAYLFAHDAGGFGLTGTDNVISCGSYTGSNTVQTSVNLGYEPQFVLIKNTTTSGNNWSVFDNIRGVTTGGVDAQLIPNLGNAELNTTDWLSFTSTGFQLIPLNNGTVNRDANNYIYIAIRRGPMKVPTTGTSVFGLSARTGTGANATVTGGQTDDAVLVKNRGSAVASLFSSRLTGTGYLVTSSTAAEVAAGTTILQANPWDVMDGVKVGTTSTITNASGSTFINYLFRRAPSFHDVVCYTGTGSARTVSHNLGVAPEMMIVKNRSITSDWRAYSANLGATQNLKPNTTDAATSSTLIWNDTTPTSSVFSVGTSAGVNGSGNNHVAYLFATCAGVLKVGSYTGNGTSQTINCGFTSGARFVMIKASSTTGDWMVSDSARGIVSGSDPYLELNNTNAEVTGEDWLDTDNTGFVVNEVSGSNANTNGVTYIFLAIA